MFSSNNNLGQIGPIITNISDLLKNVIAPSVLKYYELKQMQSMAKAATRQAQEASRQAQEYIKYQKEATKESIPSSTILLMMGGALILILLVIKK